MTDTGNDRAWHEAPYVDFEGCDDEPYTQQTEALDFQEAFDFPELKWLLLAAGGEEIAPFVVSEKGCRQDRMPANDDYEFSVTAVKM